MKILASFLLVMAFAGCSTISENKSEEGFKTLINGKNLKGWNGNSNLWSVKDGAITGQTTEANPIKVNTFLIWTGTGKAEKFVCNRTPRKGLGAEDLACQTTVIDSGEDAVVSNFELRLSYKIVPNNEKGFGNSGIQYRSKILDTNNWVVGGYQADFEAGKTYSGILYEEKGRGILAQRGQKTVIKEGDSKPKIEVTGSVGNSDEIQAAIKDGDWNDYVVIAKGNHLQHFINGKQTVDVTDEQESKAAKSGVLALQLHAGPPMTVQFKDIRIKTLK